MLLDCHIWALIVYNKLLDAFVQLYEIHRFHAMMMVGAPMIGKTSCIHTLLKIASAVDGRATVYREWRINPKSLTIDQLFGSHNATTSDWLDGVFSMLLRRATPMTRGQSLTPCCCIQVAIHLFI